MDKPALSRFLDPCGKANEVAVKREAHGARKRPSSTFFEPTAPRCIRRAGKLSKAQALNPPRRDRLGRVPGPGKTTWIARTGPRISDGRADLGKAWGNTRHPLGSERVP